MASAAVGLDIAALDIVTPDISRSMWEVGGAIVEVNSMPSFRAHVDPYCGKPDDIGEDMIAMLFPSAHRPGSRLSLFYPDPDRIRLLARLMRFSGRRLANGLGDNRFGDDERCSAAPTELAGQVAVQQLLNNPPSTSSFSNSTIMLITTNWNSISSSSQRTRSKVSGTRSERSSVSVRKPLGIKTERRILVGHQRERISDNPVVPTDYRFNEMEQRLWVFR